MDKVTAGVMNLARNIYNIAKESEKIEEMVKDDK